MKAAPLACLVAAALLVAAASSERLPTFDEYLKQTLAGAASKAKTANADYPSVAEDVQFVSSSMHDCRCLDGYWNSNHQHQRASGGDGDTCPTIYAQYNLACANKENYYGYDAHYGYDDTPVATIPVAVPVGRCDISENYFVTPGSSAMDPITVGAGVTQVGTFTGTCMVAKAVEDCEDKGPACGDMVVNVQGAIFEMDKIYLKGMPATTTASTDCTEMCGVKLARFRGAGAKNKPAGGAKAASYHDDDERPHYERRDEDYQDRKDRYDEPMFYEATAAHVYHGTMTVVSAHKSAQAYETVGTFQYVYTPIPTVHPVAVPHPTGHAFITKGNTFTFGFFKGDKYE